jgi:aldehyde dehydrogenase (NAD+)
MNLSEIDTILNGLGVAKENKGSSTGREFFGQGPVLKSYTPIDGSFLGSVTETTKEEYEAIIAKGREAYQSWRMVPAPKRGEIVRQYGNKLRENKDLLGKLVSLEMGKSLQEGWGEVQEMIDICDFAVGLSRQLHGLTMHSERELHRMYEQWHPIGTVGVISAFNFPVAVWCWNAAIAWVCGDVTVWKPSEKAPLTSIACQNIFNDVAADNDLPEGISSIINGGSAVGEWMTKDGRIPLISATGSTRMGKIVGQTVAGRLGRTILELGGNNAIIISDKADIESTLVGAVFGAVGTAGQRCTSTRRLIIHESMFDAVITSLKKAYAQLRIGNPLDTNMHVGPLIDTIAVDHYLAAIEAIKKEGGTMIVEGGVLEGDEYGSGCYVKPCIAEVQNHFDIVQSETFAPILFVMKYSDLNEAIALQNGVPQGLSSAIMTTDMRESELFLSANGSDCGIANVNIGTSGAEIGGAFGGEKETGGGRESGSDAWKAYMRRQTNTLNWSTELPLAQGISFDL